MEQRGGGRGLLETGVWLDGDVPEIDFTAEAQLQDCAFDLPPLPLPLHSAGGSGSSPATTSSDVPQPQVHTAQQKKEELRATNRVKQQRFRQKQREQKKLQQEQFEATEADLEREREANATLKVAVQLLESVKLSKDAAVDTLQRAAASDAAGGAEAKQQLFQGNEGPLLNASGVEAAARLHAMPFQQRVELCCSMFRKTESVQPIVELHGTHDREQIVDAFALDLGVRQELGDHVVAAHPQLLDAMLHMSQETMLEDWGEFCKLAEETIGLLDQGQIGEAEALERLRPGTLYNTIREAILLRHRPEAIRPLMRLRRLPGESEEAAQERWRDVSDSLEFTRDQVAELLPHYLQLESRLKQLDSQSAASLETLREVQQRLRDQLLQLESGLSPQVMQYLDLVNATGQLSSQDDMRMYLLLDFYASTGTVVTEIQKARILAACVPSLNPDIPTVVSRALQRHNLLSRMPQKQEWLQPQPPPPQQGVPKQEPVLEATGPQ